MSAEASVLARWYQIYSAKAWTHVVYLEVISRRFNFYCFFNVPPVLPTGIGMPRYTTE